jgi:D-glycero-D-manno-heptose 1,7-bisphosphate phosphatase
VNLCRAVFLDRDGTLIEEREYLSQPDGVALFAGAGPALQSLQDAGFKLFVVSNQSGVGRGYFSLEDVFRVNARMEEMLAEHGARLEKLYIAPEAPNQPSLGRKPSAEFLFQARDSFGLDLSASYMIGDKISDLECGWNAGIRKSILVRTGYGRKVEQESKDRIKAALVVDDLAAAARWILGET